MQMRNVEGVTFLSVPVDAAGRHLCRRDILA